MRGGRIQKDESGVEATLPRAEGMSVRDRASEGKQRTMRRGKMRKRCSILKGKEK